MLNQVTFCLYVYDALLSGRHRPNIKMKTKTLLLNSVMLIIIRKYIIYTLRTIHGLYLALFGTSLPG